VSPSPSDAPSSPPPVLPRGLAVVLGGAGLVVSMAGIRELGWLIAPVMLALMLAVQAQLARWGVGETQIDNFVGQIDLGRVTDVVTTVLSSLTSTASTLFFLLATMLFMGLDAAGFPDRLRRIAADRPAVVEALSSSRSSSATWSGCR
jgi:AI-2 transport protein TqsA